MKPPAPLRLTAVALDGLVKPGQGAIYLLVFPSGCYVGLTRQQLAGRWLEGHLTDLAKRRHPNDGLRAAYAQYGAAGISGTVLGLYAIQYLEAWERYWINELRRRGYKLTNEV